MEKIWKTTRPDPDLQDRLSGALNVSKITAQLLINRGLSDPQTAKEFLSCRLISCHHPSLLKDMEKAMSRINEAVSKGERILVYGDYDVDGITGVALLSSALCSLGAVVDTHIPNRLEEGYGLNLPAIRAAHKKRASLIITVDCGITSFKEVEYANSLDVDVIITDHHEIVGEKIPDAYAIINPLQGDCPYPFKHLAGVGLAYKLTESLLEGSGLLAEDFLDLVSLGTVADIVPQVGENRILTRHGLTRLNRTQRTGLRALIKASGLTGKDISSGHIGFVLGPRINAMGRIGSPRVALDLLLTDDELEASRLADVLNTENRNRQKVESRILDEALVRLQEEVDFKRHKVIVLASANWHSGVIGIVASRLVEKFCRPAILISLDGKIGKGSGRSVNNVNLFELLAKCRRALLGFGGHESACGLTIEKERIEDFREIINSVAKEYIKDEDLMPELEIDMDITLSALREKVIYEIESLAPFGPENPRPVLSSHNLIVKDIPRLIGKSGFKLHVTDRKTTCEAVSFGRGGLDIPKVGQEVDIAFTPSINTWQGLPSIQLELRSIH